MSSLIDKTYYLWGEFSHGDSVLLNQLQQKANNRLKGLGFKVHLTLSGPFHDLSEEILGRLEDIALTNDALEMRTNGYGTEDNIFQSFYIQIQISAELLHLKKTLDNFLKISPKEYNPHISLFYGKRELYVKNELIKILASPPQIITLDRISIVEIIDDIESWKVLYSYPMIDGKSAKLNLGRPI